MHLAQYADNAGRKETTINDEYNPMVKTNDKKVDDYH